MTEQQLSIESGASANYSTLNKGAGAGGANTNYYGKLFEEKTNNENASELKGAMNGGCSPELTKQATGTMAAVMGVVDKVNRALTTTGSGGESSSNAAIAPLAWLAVGLPLAYGIWVTLQKSAVLFK